MGSIVWVARTCLTWAWTGLLVPGVVGAGRMTLSDDVNLEEFVMAKDELSGADIKAVCTEAGLLALRERRMRVTQVRAQHSAVRSICQAQGSLRLEHAHAGTAARQQLAYGAGY